MITFHLKTGKTLTFNNMSREDRDYVHEGLANSANVTIKGDDGDKSFIPFESVSWVHFSA